MAKQQAESQSRLRYDLFALKKGEQVVERFTDLKNYSAFVEHGSGAENDVWARFAILYADAGSDYRNLSIEKKRQQCMDAAGVPAASPRRADVLAGTDAPVLALVIEYVRLQDWLEYATIFHGREYIWRLLASLAGPDEIAESEGNKKSKDAPGRDKNGSLLFALTQVKELDARWNALFLGDPEVKATAQAQAQRAKLHSESRAEERSKASKF